MRAGWIMAACLLLMFRQAEASLNTENSRRYVGGYRSTTADSVIIGPNAVIIVDGVWEIFSRAMWIHPSAQITGDGVIRITNPSAIIPAKPASAMYADGNDGVFIDVDIEHNNADALYITDIPYSVYTYTNPPGSLAAALKIGRDFDMVVDGADVYLNAHDFIFDSDATISGYRPERMVITGNSIAGHMVKQDYSGLFTYPVGISDGDYTPASVNNTDGINTIYVSVQDYNNSSSIESVPEEGVYRTWHIYADNVDVATVNLQHNDATEGTLYTDPLAFVTRYVGISPNTAGGQTSYSLWDYTGICNIGSGTGTMTTGPVILTASELARSYILPTSGVSTFSYVTKSVCDNSPLPVTWLYFEAERSGDDALLRWATASELNCDRFEVEHSRDGLSFSKVGEVKGGGTTHEPSEYEFVHERPGEGLHYYRLRQVDFDGQYEYSVMRTVSFEGGSGEMFAVYPNPTNGMVYVRMSQPLEAPFQVMSMNGMVVRTYLPSNLSQHEVDLKGLPAGMYVLNLNIRGVNHQRKIVLVE